MTARNNAGERQPAAYSSFNYLLEFSGPAIAGLRAGFSEISGLAAVPATPDHRDRVAGSSALAAGGSLLACKRGISRDGEEFIRWLRYASDAGAGPATTLRISLSGVGRDGSAGDPARCWELHGVRPLKWTGPSMSAKGGGEVAMEELVLSYESLRQL